MKYTAQLLLLITFCLIGIGCTASRQTSNIGDTLDSWDYYLADPQAKMHDVWRIEDGILVCTGTPLGYIYTKQDYRDFVLKLQWRWPAEKDPGKGGVLIRTTGENKIWPRSLEAQINAGDAGDFWGLAGYTLSGAPERMKSIDHEEFGKLTNLQKTKPLEFPPGEWNSYEIIAKGDSVTLIINGQQTNRATGCDPTGGRICLTSEGSEIHFKNITLTPIKAE